VAKRPLAAGEVLDGEGGSTVYGRLLSAADSLAKGALPIGLAHQVVLERSLPAGALVTRADVSAPLHVAVANARRDIEENFSKFGSQKS
jgi:predicted homoserine dehydrogenase-like protein